jgi:LPXTG-motif cell wall-anchored protein
MLIAMQQNPDGVEQVRLANNMGYLGESLDGLSADTFDEAGGKPTPTSKGQWTSSGYIPPAGGGQSATDVATKWIYSISRGAATVIPLFKKSPKKPKEIGGGGMNPQGEDNTMTYVAIGGGVLIGGILLYSMFKKKGKKK